MECCENHSIGRSLICYAQFARVLRTARLYLLSSDELIRIFCD